MEELMNDGERIVARVGREFMEDGVRLCILKVDERRRKKQVLTRQWADVEPGPLSDFAHHAVRLQPEDAQSLMDALWNCGVRPTEGTGSAGAMAAAQENLKDLRKLLDYFMRDGIAR